MLRTLHIKKHHLNASGKEIMINKIHSAMIQELPLHSKQFPLPERRAYAYLHIRMYLSSPIIKYHQYQKFVRSIQSS